MVSERTLLLACLFALPVFAAEESPVSKAQADVDGDGKPEEVTLKAEGATGFVLSVGRAQVRSSLEGGAKGFTLIDLGVRDARREVLVHGQGKVPAYLLFRWHEGALQPLPLPPGRPSASGNGILLTDVSMGFWEQRHKYLYDAGKPGFTEVPQPLYYVGKVLEPTQPITLQVSRSDTATVAQVGKGGSAVLLAYSPDPRAPADAERGWYLLKGRGGVLGWVQRPALGAQPHVSPIEKQLSPPWEPRKAETNTSLTGDLDGDGKEENISITSLPEAEPPEEEQAPEESSSSSDSERPACLDWAASRYELSINSRPGIEVGVDGCSTLVGVTIVDIDRADRRKELLVVSYSELWLGHEGDLYRAEGKKHKLSAFKVPTFTIEKETDPFMGEGTYWAWIRGEGDKLYRYDGKSLEHVPQEWKFVEESGTRQVEKAFALRYEPKEDSAVVANVRPGSTVLLLADLRPPRPGHHWFLVKSETGLMGWAISPDVHGLKVVPEGSSPRP
jgi:hypothetical protein